SRSAKERTEAWVCPETSRFTHVPRLARRGRRLLNGGSRFPRESSRAPVEIPMKTPLAIVKEKFGDKAKLVAAVKKFADSEELWVNRTASDRGQERGLDHVSNAKLLRLHATFSEVKEKFGTRAKLIAAILDLQKRSKDAGMKKRLEAYPVPRLYDL